MNTETIITGALLGLCMAILFLFKLHRENRAAQNRDLLDRLNSTHSPLTRDLDEERRLRNRSDRPEDWI
jgi:hypothetical protein